MQSSYRDASQFRLRWLLVCSLFFFCLLPLHMAEAQTNKPDLFIGSFLINPTVGPPGGPTTLTFEVQNGGNVDAGPFNATVYFSLTATLDVTKATILKSVVISGLQAGRTNVQQLTVNLPKSAPVNKIVYIAVWVDSGKTVAESNEFNNITSSTFNVKPGPDLTLDNLTLSKPNPYPNETFYLRFRLRNIGRADVKPFYVSVYLSTDALIDSQDSRVSHYRVLVLPAGKDLNQSIGIRVPSNAIINNTYYLGVIVDSTKTEIEEDESNNQAIIKFTVGPPPTVKRPDFLFTDFKLVDTSGLIGENARVTFTLKNQGDATGVAYVYVHYGLTEKFKTYRSHRVVYRYYIGAGASKVYTNLTFPVPWSSPYNQVPRDYFVRISVSGSTEHSTLNNKSATFKFRATKGKSKIDMSSLSFNPIPCNFQIDANNKIVSPNQTSGTLSIRNSGYWPSSPFRVGVYASTDSTMQTSDILLFTIDVPSIPPQASYSKNYIASLTAKVPPGDYYIGVLGDINNDILNDYGTGRKSFLVHSSSNPILFSKNRPDFVVDSFKVTPTGQAVAGAKITIEAIIKDISGRNFNIKCRYRYLNIQFGYYDDVNLRQYRYGTNSSVYLTTQSTYKVTASFTLPTTIQTGTGYIGVTADRNNYHNESNEANNSKSISYKLVSQEYDFKITGAKVSDTTLVWEKSTRVDLTIENNGALKNNFNVRICAWFSYDKNKEPQDPYIGNAYARNYSTSTPMVGYFSFTTQRWLPGNGYIILQVNCGSYQESNQADNFYYIPVKLRKFNVDFVTSKIYASPNYIRPGVKTQIFVEVQNKGLDKHIASPSVCIYFSNDNIFDTKDRRYWCRPTSGIYDKTGIAKLEITGDRSLIAGKRWIIAVLDSGIRGPYCYNGCYYSHPTYDETNEKNNIAFLPIEVKNDVDLTAGSLQVSKTLAKIGENLSFRFQVKNVGSVSTNLPFDIWAVFSDNEVIDKSDRLIKKIRLQVLDAGKTSPDFTVSYAIDKTIQPGERYFGLLIDANNEISEPDETNNIGSVKINILIPGIDLQVRTAKVDNATVPAGKPVSVDIYSEFQNFGTVTSPAFEMGYYLSNDNKFDVNDTLLVSRRYTQPLPSTARTGQFKNTVSLNLKASNNYYILVVVDPRNQVQESLETNNFKAIPLKVVNRPPRITSIAVTKAKEKQNYVYEAKAFDPDSDPLSWALLKGPLGMSVDSKTGKVTWLPQPFHGGKTFDVSLEVSDGRGGIGKQDFKVAVSSINDPPKIVSTPILRALAGREYVYAARAIDPDPGDVVSWAKLSGPTSLTVNPKTGEVKWSVPQSEAGKTVTFVIQALDKDRATDSQTVKLQIAPINRAPKITSTAIVKAFSGKKYTYNAKATDPDVGDSLVWARVSGPTGLVIDAKSGVVEWSIPQGLEGQKIPVTIRVRDQLGAFDDQTFTLAIQRVNQPPKIVSTPPKTAFYLTEMVYKAKAIDPNLGDRLTWSLFQGPPGVQFDSNTGEVRWKPGRSRVGLSFTFEINVSDPDKASDSQKFTVAVKQRCEVDSDCPTGNICNNLQCEFPGCFKAGCQSDKPICATDASCQKDLCSGKTCGAAQFCRAGSCVSSCGKVTCPKGQSCQDGKCAPDSCALVVCQQGQRCEKGKCVRDPCFSGSCRYTRVCREGRCVANPCRGIQCPTASQCFNGQCRKPPSCVLDVDCVGTSICEGGKCVSAGCLVAGRSCQGGQVCLKQSCLSDPCANKTCSAGEFCLEGRCVASCAGVSCKSNETCEYGKCVSNPCAGVTCSAGEVCVNGKCSPDQCIPGRSCKHGRICTQNKCVNDLCRLIQCPKATQQCVMGQCKNPPKCVLDYECSGRQICVKGFCILPNCGPSNPCKSSELCVDGICIANPCDGKQCSKGQVCRSGKCEDSCAGVFCKPDENCQAGQCVANPCAKVNCQKGEVCFEGKCVTQRCAASSKPCKQGRFCTPMACKENPCLQANCPAGQLCDPQTGQCSAKIPCKVDSTCPAGGICESGFCAASGCYLQTCSAGTVCRRGQCVTDRCLNVKCASGQYCLDGTCRWTCNCPKGQVCGANGCEVDPCEGVQCKAEQVCVKGVCEDKCPDKSCRYTRSCVPGQGCIDDSCDGLTCPEGTVCRSGFCLDKCMETECPDGTRCDKGQCKARPQEGTSAKENSGGEASPGEGNSSEEPSGSDQAGITSDASSTKNNGDRAATRDSVSQRDAEGEPESLTAPGGCGCDVNSPVGLLVWLWLLVGLCFLLLKRRRRRL